MGEYRELLEKATEGNKDAIEALYQRYSYLIRKYSFVDGKFDESLYQTLVIEFLEILFTFKIE